MPRARSSAASGGRPNGAHVIEHVERRLLLATTYYISPSGNDAAAGTSTSAPWKSITRINSVDLEPGDRVLFQGGQTFAAPATSASNLINDAGFESGAFNSWSQNYDVIAGSSVIS